MCANLDTSSLAGKKEASPARRWLKEAYAKHLGASYESMACAVFSFGVGTLAAAIFQKALGSGTASIAAVYGSSFLAYYGTFLPTLVYRDRAQFRNEGGKLSARCTLGKVKEYASLFALTETVFGTLRIGSMNALVHYLGASTLQAQIVSFVVLNLIYFGVLPPVRHALQGYFLGGAGRDTPEEAQHAIKPLSASANLK